VLKPKGKLLIVEPKIHDSAAAFERTIEVTRQADLRLIRATDTLQEK